MDLHHVHERRDDARGARGELPAVLRDNERGAHYEDGEDASDDDRDHEDHGRLRGECGVMDHVPGRRGVGGRGCERLGSAHARRRRRQRSLARRPRAWDTTNLVWCRRSG